MGRITTPTYRVEMTVVGWHMTPAAWPVKHASRPTDANLASYVTDFASSTEPGGVNAHLGRTVVRSARIVRQSDGQCMARWSAPMFEVVS